VGFSSDGPVISIAGYFSARAGELKRDRKKRMPKPAAKKGPLLCMKTSFVQNLIPAVCSLLETVRNLSQNESQGQTLAQPA
jgi:hypothetical protein